MPIDFSTIDLIEVMLYSLCAACLSGAVTIVVAVVVNKYRYGDSWRFTWRLVNIDGHSYRGWGLRDHVDERWNK